MISGGVEPQAAFVVGSIVGGNGSWPIVRCSASRVSNHARAASAMSAATSRRATTSSLIMPASDMQGI